MYQYDALCFNTDLVILRKTAEVLNKRRRVKLLKLAKLKVFFSES